MCVHCSGFVIVDINITSIFMRIHKSGDAHSLILQFDFFFYFLFFRLYVHAVVHIFIKIITVFRFIFVFFFYSIYEYFYAIYLNLNFIRNVYGGLDLLVSGWTKHIVTMKWNVRVKYSVEHTWCVVCTCNSIWYQNIE